MGANESIYAAARAAIEEKTQLIPGALRPGEVVSFMGDEAYSNYAFAQLTFEEFVDIIFSSSH